MDRRVKIYALGGLDEEGKDCYVVDVDGDLFVIECGIREPDKTMPGVDYVIPRFDWLRDNKDRINTMTSSGRWPTSIPRPRPRYTAAR